MTCSRRGGSGVTLARWQRKCAEPLLGRVVLQLLQAVSEVTPFTPSREG